MMFYTVPKMLSVADGKEVFFSGGAKVLQDGILVGYSPATGNNNDLYPLLCTIVSGSVREGEAHPLGPIINAGKVLRSKTALMNLHSRLAHISPESMARIDPSISRSDYDYMS